MPGVLAGQTGSTILSRELNRNEWGFQDWADIRMGQLGVVHSQEEHQLEINFLYKMVPLKLSFPVQSQTPAFTGNCYLVSEFESGVTNRLGGYFNSFEQLPSSAGAALAEGPGGYRALSLRCDKAGSGFCGVWIHLFDFKLPLRSRYYFNSEPFSNLTFWVRGRQGNEKISLKIADVEWEQKEDALAIGEVGPLLSSGRIDCSWQRAVVSLEAVPGRINRKELASISFEAETPGRTQIDIKDLAFCVGRDPLPPPPAPFVTKVQSRKLHNAIWVWNTTLILESPEEQDRLIRFLMEEELDHVFLQLPTEPKSLGPLGEAQIDAGRLRPLIAAMNRQGVKVHALDGHRNYALAEFQPSVLETVRNIVRYNEMSGASERFYGIHYDIEPYLLPGFNGEGRENILKSYLSLVRKMAHLAHQANLVVGVDIPFWYDAPDEVSGIVSRVTFNGSRKATSEHVIDLTDNVTVMDYRTSTYGADGSIAQAAGELAYASQKGKQIFIGLETTELFNEELLDFQGTPFVGFPQRAIAERVVFVAPTSENPMLYVVPAYQLKSFADLLKRQGTDMKRLLYWPVRKITPVSASKLSFANLGANLLSEMMNEASQEMETYPSFVGFALHHYESFRRLLSR
jgi:hypothetical protein